MPVLTLISEGYSHSQFNHNPGPDFSPRLCTVASASKSSLPEANEGAVTGTEEITEERGWGWGKEICSEPTWECRLQSIVTVSLEGENYVDNIAKI